MQDEYALFEKDCLVYDQGFKVWRKAKIVRTLNAVKDIYFEIVPENLEFPHYTVRVPSGHVIIKNF